jgi:hypothetical protein
MALPSKRWMMKPSLSDVERYTFLKYSKCTIGVDLRQTSNPRDAVAIHNDGTFCAIPEVGSSRIPCDLCGVDRRPSVMMAPRECLQRNFIGMPYLNILLGRNT